MGKGRIILLNGASGAGKTSISRVLQDLFEEPYLHVNIDAFLQMVPGRYFGLDPAEGDLSHEGVSFRSEVDEEGTLYRIVAGPYGYSLVYDGLHPSVAAMAAHGHNLILDDIMLEIEFLLDYVRILRDFEVWFIEVYCPIEVLKVREVERGDRLIGHMRGQYDAVYTNKIYDLSIDTSRLSPEEAAAEIKALVTSGRKPSAFDQLRMALPNDTGA